MEILLYENRKVDPICWDASTPEKKKAAFLALFKYFDEVWEFYTGMDEYSKDLEKAEKQLDVLKLMDLPEGHALFKEHIEKQERLEKSLPELKKYAEQYALIVLGRTGDTKAIERLLYWRKDYEYEFFQFIKLIDPLEEKK